MNLKNAFLLNCLLAGAFGLAFLIVPAQLMGQYGVHLMPKAGIFVARLLGASMIGVGLVSWFASARATGDLRTNLALSFFVADALGFLVSLMAMVNGVVNSMGWSVVLIYLVLALAFGYFALVRKG